MDDDPTVRATVSAEPYLEPAGAKGMRATMESYGGLRRPTPAEAQVAKEVPGT